MATLDSRKRPLWPVDLHHRIAADPLMVPTSYLGPSTYTMSSRLRKKYLACIEVSEGERKTRRHVLARFNLGRDGGPNEKQFCAPGSHGSGDACSQASSSPEAVRAMQPSSR